MRLIEEGTVDETKFKKYCKKPVVVDAYPTDEEVLIATREGKMKANIGDYIIRGVEGEIYPCKPDIFWKTYCSVNDNEEEKINHDC